MTWAKITPPFTKYTDFKGEILIVGLVPSVYDGETLVTENVIGDANIADLNLFITKYEKRLFVKLLSQDIYDDLVTALGGETEPDSKWTDLYAKLMDNPMAASYIYYWYMRNSETMQGTVGEVSPNTENATPTSVAPKMVRAWNEFTEWLLEVIEWLQTNEDVYGVQSVGGVNFYDVKGDFAYINTMNL